MTRKVLVTAGASGIGKHIAAAFLAVGDDVYICDISADALAAAGAELAGLKTGLCDVADRDQVRKMVADAAEKLGGIDVLVNNAGIAGPTAPIQDFDPEQWDAVLRVNLTGTFTVTKYAVPHLIAAGKGAVITMSSAAGRFGYPNRSAYSTTKWGLIGFTKTLAMELGRYNIRANAILPGSTDGERFQRVLRGRAEISGEPPDVQLAHALSKQSLKYLVQPQDIGAVAVFLASDAARSISGQTFPMDGDLQSN